jgi:NADPH-dependent 2,4-dienoyl-CoA reductase/sulfur reductase-like enzyme
MGDAPFKFEIAIVGGGPAGLAAACAAGESGCQVGLVEAGHCLGGQIWRGEWPQPPAAHNSDRPNSKTSGRNGFARYWLERFQHSGATLLDRTTIIATPRSGVLLAEHSDGPREIHFDCLIVATGARELFLPFPGWTLPGVMGPGGLAALAKAGWPVRNQRVAVAGSGPLLLAASDTLAKCGARVVSISDQTAWRNVLGFGLGLAKHPAKLLQAAQLKLRLSGTPYRFGVWPVAATGDRQVRGVTLSDGRRRWTEECDLLACGFGLLPNVELPLSLGCELTGSTIKVDEWQATTVPGVYCAGEPTGIAGVDCALVEGQIAGYVAAGRADAAQALFGQRKSGHQFRAALAKAFALRPELKTLARDDTIICRCEDITFGQLRSFGNWREAKLQSRCGMGSCQGRVCGGATKVLFGWGMESVRPPLLPTPVRNLIAQTGAHLPAEPPKSKVRTHPLNCSGLRLDDDFGNVIK